MSSTGADGPGVSIRCFSGEDEDVKEYRRWKTWVQNKLLTLDKLPKAARGSYIYTLLSGKALETVEHLKAEDYQKEGGEAVLWDLLDARFPQKEASDEMGEILGEVFALKAKDNEALKAWIARATEIFDRCARRAQVSFPSEARGWILLHRAGLTTEQQAVILARAQGSLKRDVISTAMRSCYPELTLGNRRSTAAHVVESVNEPVENEDSLGPDETDFKDVELLLAEHEQFTVSDANDSSEVFWESEVAEVLAVSWKEKRSELNKLQKQRKFTAAKELRRSFRIEVEELKKKTKCHRCGKQGHWSRECRQPRRDDGGKGSGKHSASSSMSTKPSGAALVETEPLEFVAYVETVPTEVAMVEDSPSMLERLRALVADRRPPLPNADLKPKFDEVMLVSSPGYGVLDSGCGRTIIGARTLAAFEKLWTEAGILIPSRQKECNSFKFGNGATEVSTETVPMPVFLAGRRGVISAAIVQGDAPLLVSRSALRALQACIDFHKQEIRLFADQVNVPLSVNSAGQYVLDLLEHRPGPPAAEVLMQEAVVSSDTHGDEDRPSPQVAVDNNKPKKFGWFREDWGIAHTPVDSEGGPSWNRVHRRIVKDGKSGKVLYNELIDHTKPKNSYRHGFSHSLDCVHTTFVHDDPDVGHSSTGVLSPHQTRQLCSKMKHCAAVQSTSPVGHKHKLMVIEVFSPPRFSKVCEEAGFKARSIDLITGQDLSLPQTRKELVQEITQHPPELLILCPPCTDEGGWFNLNCHKWDHFEYLRRVRRSRSFIRFCLELFKLQTSLGGRALFEHPTGARTWHYPEMKTLCRRFPVVKCHMCCFGLQIPGSDRYIRKSTKLLVSHDDMKVLGRTCPGHNDPKHDQHDVVAGSHPSIGKISTFAGQYTEEFVRAVLETVPAFKSHEMLEVIQDDCPSETWTEVLVASIETQKPEVTDEQLKNLVLKVHKNLGHPQSSDLIRILKNAEASERAIQIARNLECPVCIGQSRPKPAAPAQGHRVLEFNSQIGIDVKLLPGWQTNQKIKALNIVDTASGFQRVIPFFTTETSSVLLKLLRDHWFSWAGPPKEIVLDPSGTNLGEPLVVPFEDLGVHIRPIAAGAHYQLGKTESHGGWFERVLSKVLSEYPPQNQDMWLECVADSHVKNQMLQNHGVSPHQFVFGRNPHIPSDLLNEPQNLVANTASLTDEALQRSQQIRTAARQAVIQLQDDRSLRLALAARSRCVAEFPPGEMVAYWRNQKWVAGKLQLGGRWYGTALVLGKVGRNYVIVHRRQVLRVAPEQLRLATTEERTVLETPGAQLLGIKDLIEGGGFQSKQYVDLIHQDYPSMSPEVHAQPCSPDESLSPPEVAHVPVDQPSRESPDLLTTAPSQPPAPGQEPAEPMASHPYSTEQDQVSNAPPTGEAYGPVRRKIMQKSGPGALWRPPALRQEDFVSIMKEVTPRLIEEIVNQDSSTSDASSASTHGQKRSLETPADESHEPESSRLRTASPGHEILSVETIDACESIDVLIAEYLQSRMKKEFRHSNNEAWLQEKVDEGKKLEWQTMANKPGIVKLHYGKAAAKIKETQAHRFIGSRFVLTPKPVSEGENVDVNNPETFTVKGRWCLQGHLDPDLQQKAEEGKLQSPTLNQMSRMLLMQTIASHGWDLQLGDIKSAFLEAGPLEEKYRPLYAQQPPGGIPNVPSDAVIEVLGNIYGQNDAPASWFSTFCQSAKDGGWQQSAFDSCLFTLRSQKSNKLIGIMGVHVDDTALGGEGPEFLEAVRKLKERFPYRKWRINDGEFCGAFYRQCTKTKKIQMSMQNFATKMRPAHIKKGTSPEQELTPYQIKQLRGINGSLNWLASQSRPDFSAQTSLSQQAFPSPKIKHLRQANNVVRRARLHQDLTVCFEPISPQKLTIVCHSDAAFANVGVHTQAGHIVAFTDSDLQEGELVPWVPATWKSHKLNRAVSSTMAAESQSMAVATGTVEWLLMLMAEVLDGSFPMSQCRTVLNRRKPIIVTDCKSLYDHLLSPSAPTAIEDRRTSIDVTIIRESVKAMQAHVRWVPTSRMLADGLTKDCGDPLDLLRSCMKNASYQISPESTVLEMQALEREDRLQRRIDGTSSQSDNSGVA